MSYMPVLKDLTFDWRVAVFAALVATLTVLLAGVLPAVLAARTAIRAPLQESIRRAPAGRLRRTLTAAQVALSLALVASAGVLAESVARLRSVDLGFDPERLLTVTLQPRRAAGANAGAFFGEVERRLSAAPGIDAVGVAASPPLGSYLRTDVMVSPEVPAAPSILRYVSSDYFRAMRIPVVAGRMFTAAEAEDQGTGGPAIIDELVAQHLFGVAPALGRSIHVRRRDVMELHRIVGVVGATAWSLHESRRPTVYLPVADLRVATFYMRSAVPVAEGMQIVRRVVREFDPLLVIDVQTIDSHIDRLTSQPRVQARLAAMLAIFAFALAVVGVYSAASAAAQARTREFGIRMALGASRRAIERDVVGGAGRTAAFGLAGGVLLYAWTSRYLESELYSISALDALTIVVACGLLFTVAVGAAWLPARRAARVDPTVALCAE